MAEIRIGNTEPLEPIDEEVEFDFQHGTRVTLTFEGTEQTMKALAAQFGTVGNGRPYRHDGPVWRCRITGGPELLGSGDPPVLERWSRKTSMRQVDIRNNPKLIAVAGNEGNLGRWVQDIKRILKDGDPSNPSWATIEADFNGISGAVRQAAKLELLKMMARGTDSYEVNEVMLVERLISPLSHLHQSEIWAVPVFYSTPAFVSGYGVPGALAAKLPANPAEKPSGTEWGWKERDNEEDITPVYDKVEGVRTWVFSAWSTLLYNYVQ